MTPKIRFVLASVLAAAALGAIAPAANAYIYWASYGDSAIGRANLDGSNSNQTFITGADHPDGIAVDDNHIYWANFPATIGRADLDGSNANQSFITGASLPAGVAVDGNYIYWANNSTDTIGRANLDGTGANQSFITGASGPWGVAVNGNYIYWANSSTDTIGRANLDGTGANQSFITGVGPIVQGIAVDDNYIYWSNFNGTNFGRGNLDGTGVNNNFLAVAFYSRGMAADDNYIYWGSDAANAIARAKLDGTGLNQSFITGTNQALAVAVDPLPHPTISRAAKPTKRSLKVKVGCGDGNACTLQLTGKKVGTNALITPKTVSVGVGEQPTVTLHYSTRLRRALVSGGRVSVTATNTTSDGKKSIVMRVAR